MLNILNLYRIKIAILIRQFYLPGMRGAAVIFFVNVLILVMLRVATRRMARLAAQQASQLAKPARRLAYAPAHR